MRSRGRGARTGAAIAITGLAIAAGGAIRDVVVNLPGGASAETPYVIVFGLEMALLLGAIIVVIPLRRHTRGEGFKGKAELLRDIDRRRLEEA